MELGRFRPGIFWAGTLLTRTLWWDDFVSDIIVNSLIYTQIYVYIYIFIWAIPKWMYGTFTKVL